MLPRDVLMSTRVQPSVIEVVIIESCFLLSEDSEPAFCPVIAHDAAARTASITLKTIFFIIATYLDSHSRVKTLIYAAEIVVASADFGGILLIVGTPESHN